MMGFLWLDPEVLANMNPKLLQAVDATTPASTASSSASSSSELAAVAAQLGQ